MQNAELNVVARDTGLKSTIRKLREKGMVPANIYGPGLKNNYCSFSEQELRKVFNNDFNTNYVLSLKSEAAGLKGKKVILKSVERDSVTWKLTHADLYEISMDRPITVDLPLHYTGTAAGVKDSGGIFQIIRRTVKIKALPGDIPPALDVDITALPLGGSLHLKDVKLDPKWKVLDSLNFTLASVVEPEKEEVVAPVVAAAGEGVAAAASTDAAATAAAGDKKAGDKKAEPAKK